LVQPVQFEILEVTGVQPATRVKDLTEAEVSKINTEIAKSFKVEGDLRREISANVRRLIEIGAYRGSRHRRNLPARGQRTKSNARTRRGRRRTVGSAKPGTTGAPAAAPAKA
jgi:small subunit ribosomal protein S13